MKMIEAAMIQEQAYAARARGMHLAEQHPEFGPFLRQEFDGVTFNTDLLAMAALAAELDRKPDRDKIARAIFNVLGSWDMPDQVTAPWRDAKWLKAADKVIEDLQ